ncbi:hypothetical protein SD78_1181 [Bacillus badius]|nr:hypothetical protein SD78_1181 [Bacillus badius]
MLSKFVKKRRLLKKTFDSKKSHFFYQPDESIQTFYWLGIK